MTKRLNRQRRHLHRLFIPQWLVQATHQFQEAPEILARQDVRYGH